SIVFLDILAVDVFRKGGRVDGALMYDRQQVARQLLCAWIRDPLPLARAFHRAATAASPGTATLIRPQHRQIRALRFIPRFQPLARPKTLAWQFLINEWFRSIPFSTSARSKPITRCQAILGFSKHRINTSICFPSRPKSAGTMASRKSSARL